MTIGVWEGDSEVSCASRAAKGDWEHESSELDVWMDRGAARTKRIRL